MATLEKIRSKSVLLVSIIFVALFLFIITIIDNPLNLFKDTTTAAKVDGEKISIETVRARVNDNQYELAQSQLTSVNQQRLALNQLIDETLLGKQAEALGIHVSADELSSALYGQNAIPQYVQAFSQLTTDFVPGGLSPELARRIIDDPSAYQVSGDVAARLNAIFSRFEQEVENDLLGNKYLMMISGAINANKLDVAAANQDAVTTYAVAKVGKSIYNNTDTVTADEMKAYYNAHRGKYRVDEPKRHVRYFVAPIAPSTADRNVVFEKVYADREAVNGNEAGYDEINMKGNYQVQRGIGTADQIAQANFADQAALTLFLNNAEPYQADILDPRAANAMSNPHLTIAQLISRENKVYSANVNRIALDPTINGDSILAHLNAGVDPGEVEGVARIIPATKMQFNELPAEIVDSMRTVGVGKYILSQTPQGDRFALGIDSYGDPEDVYEFFVATYDIAPSRETIEQLRTSLNDFIVVATSPAEFNEENALEHGGPIIRDAYIGQSDYILGQNELNTQELVNWALNASPGSVSRLMTSPDGSAFMGAAVVSKFNEYIPMSYPEVQFEVRRNAQLDKNANQIIENINGKASSLEGYASLLNAAATDTIQGVNLSDVRFAELGKIRGHKAGELVGPMKYNGQVIVATVIEANDSELPADDESARNKFVNEARRMVFSNGLSSIFRENKKIEYKLDRFTGGEY